VVNRQTEEARPKRRTAVQVSIPADRLPRQVQVVSPDWAGKKRAEAQIARGLLTITMPEVEAYSVAVLEYDELPPLTLTGRTMIPSWQWARPVRNEFVFGKDGLLRDPWALPGMLQGRLHEHLRNPPSFAVNMPQGGSLRVHVRGVATLGAKLQWQVDGQDRKTVDLPDRDGKNESMAREYDQTFDFPIPPGRHRLTLDNVGGDWACIGWYALAGETADP
jgi:hypothetical protein